MVSSEEIRRRLEAKRRGETFSEVKKTPPSSSASKTCPECQTSNPESAKFCVGCGAPLAREETPTTSNEVIPSPPSEVTSPASSEETPTPTPTLTAEDFKQCPSCGQKNKPDAKFCIICGHKFENETDFENESTEKPLEPLVEVVEEEKEAPVAETKPIVSPSENEADLQEPVTEPEPVETPETETPEKSVIPEVKVPEQFKSNNVQPEKEISPAESAEVQSQEETAPAEDPVIRIKKAKELLDIGAITQEEFDKIKNKYLDLI